MQPGPPRGAAEVLEVTITPEMAATVDGEVIHEVYGTQALVGHMEQVCRNLLVDHLEEGEEGIGHHIDVTQRSPVPVGATVELTATVAQVSPQRLMCEVVVRWNGRMVARGSFDQRIVHSRDFLAEIEPEQ